MKSIIARYALHDEKSGAISCRGPLTANCRSPARRVSGRSAVTRARFFACRGKAINEGSSVSTIVDTEHVCRRHAYEDIPRIVQQTKRLLIDHHRWRWRLPEPDVQIAQSIAAEVTSTRARR